MLSCSCINIKHRGRRCSNKVKWRCAKCGATLCNQCNRDHHAHPKSVAAADEPGSALSRLPYTLGID